MSDTQRTRPLDLSSPVFLASHYRIRCLSCRSSQPSNLLNLHPPSTVVAPQGLIVQLLRAGTIFRALTHHQNILLRRPGLRIGIMPPKQATLGYVKTQQTLGFVVLDSWTSTSVSQFVILFARLMWGSGGFLPYQPGRNLQCSSRQS